MPHEQPRWQGFAGSIAQNHYRHLVPATFQSWAEDLVEPAAPRPGERLLVVACGSDFALDSIPSAPIRPRMRAADGKRTARPVDAMPGKAVVLFRPSLGEMC